MSPELRVLSAKEVISYFKNEGFDVISRTGSHVKLRRIKEYKKETLIIPDHKELDRGTLKAIIRQASKYISIDVLRDYFYVNN